MRITQEDKENIDDLVSALKKGAVLVLPTDTVYGLICDATNKKAVEKIFKIKRRSKEKPLPVFVDSISMAKKYATFGNKDEIFLKDKWPGATTVVLQKKDGLAKLVYKNDTIALRQPDYGMILKIIGLLKKPLAQTSANISGIETPTDIDEVVKDFIKGDVQPDIVVGAGILPKRSPSVIIDLTEEDLKILRR